MYLLMIIQLIIAVWQIKKKHLVRNVTVYIAPVQQAFQTMWGFLVGFFFSTFKESQKSWISFFKKNTTFPLK